MTGGEEPVSSQIVEVAGYPVALDRAYDGSGHFWVVQNPGSPETTLRLGMDALGVDTSGTIAQLAFTPVGERLVRGEAFGSLEAAKFVGPLTSPLTGVITAHNEAVVADPGLVERDPYGAGWLIELAAADPLELVLLVRGGDEVTAWFAAEVEDYRLKGVVAE